MSNRTAAAVLVGLLGAGVLRLVRAWHGGGGRADAIGIAITSIALLGYAYLTFRRADR